MKTSLLRRHRAGYISFLLVLATGAILTALMLAAYRRAQGAQIIESGVQLRLDYVEKEEAILRSIVSITPNKAIRVMQPESRVAGTSAQLSWQSIFTEAFVQANARKAILDGSDGTENVLGALNIPKLQLSNSGDSSDLRSPAQIFSAIALDPLLVTNPPVPTTSARGYVSPGINRSLAGGYPAPMTLTGSNADLEFEYPIISNDKVYGSLAETPANTGLKSPTLNGDGTKAYGLPVANYPRFNLLKYPNISFGYTRPGEAFVAKRNWWAFSLDVAAQNRGSTGVVRPLRNFVLSIYEIPSQLSISAASYMSLGQYASGEAWGNVNIDGNMFVGKADLTGTKSFDTLALRRGMTGSSGSRINGVNSNNPFSVGPDALSKSDSYKLSGGTFFPVSLASESGRVAFVPINRGAAFFDRFDEDENDLTESAGSLNHVANNVLSRTSWNNYSIGAQQCAMRLDIIAVESPTNPKASKLRFQYFLPSGNRYSEEIPSNNGVLPTLPKGYVEVCKQGGTCALSEISDVAYGASGGFTFRYGVSNSVTFDNASFGDPMPDTPKVGYVRRNSSGASVRLPFSPGTVLTRGQECIEVYPERIKDYLLMVGAAGPEINNSIAVNVDYSVTGLGVKYKPSIPCHPINLSDPVKDYGVVLKECYNLTSFPKGFSLVTNLRLFMGDHFNKVTTTPPAGYTPAVTPSNLTGSFYPPCSLFTPEKRYGTDIDPLSVRLHGQLGSVAKVDKIKNSDADVAIIRPLESKTAGGNALAANKIDVNLSQIRHPAELPPITMMNWLVLLEEVRTY
jgi:hypothetical protein